MNVTYLSPAHEHPVGGVRMFYVQAMGINSLGTQAFVFHPERPAFSCTWFQHNLSPRTTDGFDPRKDFVIIPEVWALQYGTQLANLRVPYAVFVQNGYLIHQGVKREWSSQLASVYEQAAFVMSISSNTTALLNLAFPQLPHSRFFHCTPFISPALYSSAKQPLITYMPRKLSRHSEAVCAYLQGSLPPNWSILAIQKKSDEELRAILSRSSIFMSFSELEGLGAPPIEAALSGNIVIGYSGGGGDEYFTSPIFHRIQNGDIHSYVTTVTRFASAIEEARQAPGLQEQMALLTLRYGAGALATNTRQLVDRIHSCLPRR